MNDITKRIAALSPEKRALLLERLQKQKAPTKPKIQKKSRTDSATFPLSFSQQRLWFLDRLETDSPVYNVPAAVEIEGKLDINILERCFGAIAYRHESLRTHFDLLDGQPVQIIEPSSELKISVINLCNLSDSEQTAKIRELATNEAKKPFDLSQSPLLRITLLRLESERQILLFTMHHIVSDAWSKGVLIRDFTQLYTSFLANQEANLPDLPIQYADFAVWQREWLQGETLQTQLSYWRERLKNLPPPLELPSDRPRPDRQTFRGAVQQFIVPPALTETLQSFSQQQDATLYMTLLAAFKTLLYRYTNQTDITVGSPIANRNRAEIEGLIGFFTNTLVLRTDLANNPTFLDVLLRVRETALGAYSHQDIPFEKLVETLQPERHLSHSPLFQVLLAFHDIPVLPKLPGLTFKLLDLDSATAKFDLSLLIRLDPEQGLIGTLEYNCDLFDSGTIERLAQHFLILLNSIIADPNQPISHLELLSPTEKHQLLETWNQTDSNYPQKSVHQLFEIQVAETPNAIAVEFGSETLTYSALNRKANQLAHRLRSLGILANSPVGICLRRSPLMAVAVLGTLKAGAAYVPLDPNYPEAHLRNAIADARIQVLLTQKDIVAELPSVDSVLCLDSDYSSIDTESEDNLLEVATPDNFAYIIYTSGSTGKPKGVTMTHRALSNLIYWQRENSQLATGAKTLQFTSLSFDVSFQEFFSTWSQSGTLVLINETLRQDPDRLLEFLVEGEIERLFLPFVALSQIAEAAERKGIIPQHLRKVITAGEQLQITSAIAQFFQALPECILQNQYGPSETHVVTAYTLRGKPETWSLLPPIGKAIANVETYLLDRYLQPVPIGIPGELYVGGVALARGYLNQSELTAQKFIPHPFRVGSRLYRTGDLARYLPALKDTASHNRNLQYLGRRDRQVKLRGFRIELGEIEAVLSQHPAVKEVALKVWSEQELSDRRLVAYIVSKTQPAPSFEELRTFLRTRLPQYMIPATFVTLNALPLTPSGKIDRSALPKPQKDYATAASYIAPRSPLERQIAAIWQEVLDIERAGINDNFFDLGGHSLLLIQLRTRLETLLSRDIPLVELFQYPTIAAFSERIGTEKIEQPSSEIEQRSRLRRTKLQQQRQRRLDNTKY
ncbi:Non-ribosomal peptide synthetase [Hyella patelloides LEGE 07179]|uniref:Non-ribosomal peptide synthetase n=1 Tax=Hyella patelloides LEGE 07179 TaxID=945734 RepID=A0A563VNJ4_9CYAN|nr:non-ribosomal peptide synthetase [Hyella patelloides]VEP12991.1 Non-ribosomal peptide synthetase [Hyella patelloides LEGE 07179]